MRTTHTDTFSPLSLLNDFHPDFLHNEKQRFFYSRNYYEFCSSTYICHSKGSLVVNNNKNVTRQHTSINTMKQMQRCMNIRATWQENRDCATSGFHVLLCARVWWLTKIVYFCMQHLHERIPMNVQYEWQITLLCVYGEYAVEHLNRLMVKQRNCPFGPFGEYGLLGPQMCLKFVAMHKSIHE